MGLRYSTIKLRHNDTKSSRHGKFLLEFETLSNLIETNLFFQQ